MPGGSGGGHGGYGGFWGGVYGGWCMRGTGGMLGFGEGCTGGAWEFRVVSCSSILLCAALPDAMCLIFFHILLGLCVLLHHQMILRHCNSALGFLFFANLVEYRYSIVVLSLYVCA